jgi:uncharacterized protein (UPF0335 family)
MSTIGHNSGDEVITPEAAKRLKSIVERIETVESEQKDLAETKRDIYAEAKGVGYDTKALRKLVQRRKLDAKVRAAEDAVLETYEGVFA